MMKKTLTHTLLAFGLLLFSCKEILEPKPVDLLTTDLALNEPNDVTAVTTGLYSAARGTAAPMIIAGDFTADLLVHNGTFTQYQEFSNKQITPANGSVAALWSSVYNTAYVANFIFEKLPGLAGVRKSTKSQTMATAHFLRGYAFFIGAYTFGDIPLTKTTDLPTNRNIARSPKEEVMAQVLEDYNYALDSLPDKDPDLPTASPAIASKWAVRAALARYHLYKGEWEQAEQRATEVIASGKYTLLPSYASLVNNDLTEEAILEMSYTNTDDPGTSANYGLNDLFLGRREIIPSNQAVVALNSAESGERSSSISFNPRNLVGSDNGWSVRKYGTKDENNNNIVLFRLGEMYLIRAEARARQGKVNGDNSAETDINVLRKRAKANDTGAVGQAAMLTEIENERLYELAYEGHRWYDLVRTGRVTAVMSAFSPNWKSTYEKWPVPLNEIQNNPALTGAQNPGY